ncbi:MAG: glycyl-radical enzyme activating protein [Emergencia sp.]
MMIFNVQKCSIHDGYGLRTLVFFKGCPLRCIWCANPESQDCRPEIMESRSRCIGCGVCMDVCPNSAIRITDDGPVIDRSACSRCFACTESCYAGAKYQIGREYTSEELYREIEKDRIFYTIKGGGVTFSGGEPLIHPDELTAIAGICREHGVNVAVESCGMGDFEKFRQALPYIDSMFIDIKHIDSARHKELTGAGNELILKNISRIAGSGIPVTIRTPVVPGLNDTEENICGIAEFLKDIPQVTGYELLPYHQLGAGKYAALGREYLLRDVQPPSDSQMKMLVKAANLVLAGSGKACFYTKDNKKETIM